MRSNIIATVEKSHATIWNIWHCTYLDHENLEFRLVSRPEPRAKRFNLDTSKPFLPQTNTNKTSSQSIVIFDFRNFWTLLVLTTSIAFDLNLSTSFWTVNWTWTLTDVLKMKTEVGEWRFVELRSWLFYRKGSDQLKETNCREAGEVGNDAMVKASLSLSLNWLHWDGVNWLPPPIV